RRHHTRLQGDWSSDVCSSDLDQLLQTAGRLWIAGAQIDWNAMRGPRAGRRIALPSYPFERQRYWIEAPSAGAMADMPLPQDTARSEGPSCRERVVSAVVWGTL